MTFYLQSEFVVVQCGSVKEGGCNLTFAMGRDFYNETQRTHQTWYCPNGHRWTWSGKTTQQQLEAAEARERHLADQLHAAEADAESSRVALLRDRHRFANGVCPCCNRTFDNVRRHMSTEHPTYDPGNLKAPRYKCSCGRSFESLHGLRIHQGRSRPDDWTDPKRGPYRRHLTVTT